MRRLSLIVVAASLRIANAQPAPDAGVPAEPAPAPTEPAPAPPEPAPTTPPAEPAPDVKPAVEDLQLTDADRRHAADRICRAHDPQCNWVATFSSLERRSIGRVLTARGVVVEPEPWGKVIDKVLVTNEEVFAEEGDEWWLDVLHFFNHFHYTTRESRVRQELTIQAGEVWDQDRIDESGRRLHDPLYTSVVALLPVKSTTPGRVDLLVVTRDIWSLRLNTTYTFQQGGLTNLAFSLSENNFLGERDVLAAAVVMDPGSIAIGPLFIDKDFLGRHIDFRVRVDEILTRKVGKVFDPAAMTLSPFPGDSKGLQDGGGLHSEGSDATVTISRPLWSLATEWGAGASVTYKDAVARSFTGVHGDPYELRADPGTGLPREYRFRTWSVNANGVRQWGTDWKQQVSFGYTLSSQRPSLLPSFDSFDQATKDQYIADVFPHSEVISQPFVGYLVFQPRYKTIRNVGTYDLAEDLQIGPSLSATLAQGLAALGGDHTFTRPTLSLGYTLPWAKDGYVHPSVTGSMRFQSDTPHGWSSIDNSAGADLRIVTPSTRYVRVVAEAQILTRWHDTTNGFFAIGSDSGLRGYNLNEFFTTGDNSARAVSTVIEARQTPIPLWVFRFGGVAYYEVGGVADSLAQMKLFNDIGVGARLLVPQTSRELFRFDLAFPMQSAQNNPAWHPHFIAGFDSYF